MRKVIVVNSTAVPGPSYPELIDKEVYLIDDDVLEDGDWSLVTLALSGDDFVPYLVNNCDLEELA